MMQFLPGVTVRTTEPTVIVDAGLEPGTHRFKLVVVDEEGNESAASERDVTVRKPRGVTPEARRDT